MTSHPTFTPPDSSPDLVTLIDALVEAIDTDRDDAVDRVRDALGPFGGSTLFTAELRLNGWSSDRLWSFLTDFEAEVV
jgi:hypothetical protein